MTGVGTCTIAFRTVADLAVPELERGAGRHGLGRRLGRLAARDAVARLLGSAVGTVEVQRGPHGRPLVTVGTDDRSVGVTISHEHDRAVAVAFVEVHGRRRVAFGVDLHRPRTPRPDGATELMRRRVLTPVELDGGRWRSPAAVEVAICAKEAVGKALKPDDPTVRWHDVELDHAGCPAAAPVVDGWSPFAVLGWRGRGRAGRCSLYAGDGTLLAVAEGTW